MRCASLHNFAPQWLSCGQQRLPIIGSPLLTCRQSGELWVNFRLAQYFLFTPAMHLWWALLGTVESGEVLASMASRKQFRLTILIPPFWAPILGYSGSPVFTSLASYHAETLPLPTSMPLQDTQVAHSGTSMQLHLMGRSRSRCVIQLPAKLNTTVARGSATGGIPVTAWFKVYWTLGNVHGMMYVCCQVRCNIIFVVGVLVDELESHRTLHR